MPTLKSIATTHQTITSKTIKNERLLQELLETEKIGLIKSRIVNRQDEPIQVWKTNLKQPLNIRQSLLEFAKNLRQRKIKSETTLRKTQNDGT